MWPRPPTTFHGCSTRYSAARSNSSTRRAPALPGRFGCRESPTRGTRRSSMAVMRSVLYVPGNSEDMVGKAPRNPADIITIDLEDSVPPAEKDKAREVTKKNLKEVGKNG